MNLFAEAKKVLDKDGKVNALGPYGKQKLTGKEVSQYFKKNKVSDPQVKKAVEVALDLGGADTVARQEIKKFYGDKILKSKEVQNALRHANEEVVKEEVLDENIQKVIKMFPRDNSWKKLVMRHRRAIDDFRKNKKDLPAKVEDELLSWGFDAGEISNEDDAERFIDDILNEKFKPYIMKGYERVTDFYVQFRGGRGDRITSPENKKDFETAKKMITAYGKKHKLNIKDSPRQRIFGTPEEGSSAYKISLYAKHHTNDPNHDLAPLLDQISKLKTAEDHGGGNAKPIKEETITEGKNLVPAIKKIVDTKGAAKVGGIMIDMFTASMISQIYDKVNDQNKKRMENSNISTLVDIAQRMMQKNSVEEVDEGAFSVKLNKPYKRGDEKMYMDIIKKYGGKNLKFSPPKGRDLELDITFDGGDVKKIKSNLPNKGKDSEWISEEVINEKIEYVEYKFKNKNDAQKALNYFKGINLMKLNINDDSIRMGELAVDAGNKDMTKYHKEVMRKFKPKVQVQEKSAAQQAAIAIAKKEKGEKPKNESVMDTYRQMWEDALNEQVSDITVDPRNKISKSADQNKHAMEIAKQAKRFGLKSSMMGKHVRVKGNKKAVNDFLRIIIGKSSYGDPTEKDTSTPQIDKMLTKGLK